MTVPAQTPPADELAAVREQVRTLEQREAELRQLMISDPSARRGNHYTAELQEIKVSRTDIKELRAMYPELVDEYTYPVSTLRLVLTETKE